MSYYDETWERIAEKQAQRSVAQKVAVLIRGLDYQGIVSVLKASTDTNVRWRIAAMLAEENLDRTPMVCEIQQVLDLEG